MASEGFRKEGFRKGIRKGLRNLLLLAALCASAARAQLDLGSGDIPQDRIDAYMEPFYKVIASGIGAGRFFPDGSQAFPHGQAGSAADLGYEAGIQSDLVPLPDEKPFQSADLWALPLFRIRGGLRWGGAMVMARGLVWKDPRIGDISTFGTGLAYVLEWPGLGMPLTTTLMAGWDVLDFTSTYTYKYRGSVLGLFDQDIPGDYSLLEQVYAGGVMVSTGRGPWRGYLQTGFEAASGRFAYLYLDPRDSNTHAIRSDLLLPGVRLAAGLGGYGFRLEAGWRSYPYFEVGWVVSR